MRRYLIDTDIRKTILFKLVMGSFLLALLISIIVRPLGMKLIPISSDTTFFTFASKAFSITSIFFAILSILFNKFIWKISIAKKWHKIPDLNGVWKGELRSSFIDENTGEKKLRKCIMKVDQSWDKIQFKCTFDDGNLEETDKIDSLFKEDKSYSQSINVAFSLNAIDGVNVSFDYVNKGNKSNGGTKKHLGYNVFTYLEDEDILDGIYFTDANRKNQGEMILKRVSSTKVAKQGV